MLNYNVTQPGSQLINCYFKCAGPECFLKRLNCASLLKPHVKCLQQSAHYRNNDFQETTLEKDGVAVLCFASTYGFRNIQNLVQKLKRGKSPYHFVEVMACPSGKVKYLDL